MTDKLRLPSFDTVKVGDDEVWVLKIPAERYYLFMLHALFYRDSLKEYPVIRVKIEATYREFLARNFNEPAPGDCPHG